MDLEAQRKDEDRQEEEVTEELKRFIIQEMANGFFFEEALLVFETQDLNVDWYMKVAAAVQQAIQCYHVIHDEEKKKKKLLLRHHWIVFFKRVDRIEYSEEPEPMS